MLRRIALLVTLTAFVGCLHKAPRITETPPYPLSRAAVHVSVNRMEYKPRVEEALRDAGIRLSSQPEELGYMLRVDVGGTKWVGDCGSIRNVRYELTYAILPAVSSTYLDREGIAEAVLGDEQMVTEGGTAIEMVARGWDGYCDDNIFNEVAAKLAAEMTGSVKIIESDERFTEEDPRFSSLPQEWVHPTHAADSNAYYGDRRDCMDEADTGSRSSGRIAYDHERFDVCMKARGWRRR